MSATLAIVIYSCLATAPLDDFDPHRIDAAAHYVSLHPDVCREEPPLLLGEAESTQQCQTRAMMDVMPGWSQQNPERVWIGANAWRRWREAAIKALVQRPKTLSLSRKQQLREARGRVLTPDGRRHIVALL
jgi:hypothetical protein